MSYLRIYTHEELKRKIKSGLISPIYFIYGNEPYLINHYVNMIADRAVSALPEINLKSIDSDFDVDEIISNAYLVPMMSNYKCIILNDFDLGKLTESDIKKLLEMAKNPSDVAVVIFKFTSIEVSLGNSYKSKKLSKNFREIAKAIEEGEGIIAEVNHMTVGEISKTLTAGALKRGCTLDSATARYMIEVCSDDLTTLLCEMEKLCSYLSNGVITKEHVDKICTRSVNARIFDMSKMVLSKNVKSSMKILDDLLYQKVKEIEIVYELSKTYIDIYRMSSSKRANVSISDVSKYFEYGNRDFVLKSASNFASLLSSNQLEESLQALCEAATMLMGASKMKKPDVLKTLILRLILIASKEVTI